MFFFTECSTFCSFLSELPLFCPCKWGVLFQNVKTVTTAATKGLLGYNSRCIIIKDINKLDDDVASMTFHTSCSFAILNNKYVFTFLAMEQYVTKSVFTNNDKRTTFKCSVHDKTHVYWEPITCKGGQERGDWYPLTPSQRLTQAAPKTHTKVNFVFCVVLLFFTTHFIIRHITAPFCVFLMIMLIYLMYVCWYAWPTCFRKLEALKCKL